MTARRVFVALLAALAVLDLLVLGIRVADIFTHGRLVPLAAEGPVMYAIWKVTNGYPLYEWPTRPYYALTLYNFLFYKTYAALFEVLRISNEAMTTNGRMVTMAFAFAGAAAQYAVGRRVTPPSFRVPLALLSLVTWIGSVMPGWWALSIRPDVPASVFATLGLAAALTAFQTERRSWLLAAGGAFLLTWTFKQSQVALLAATCAYIVVWRRSFRELLLVAAPVVVGAALTMDIGRSVYRANVIDAPRVNELVPYLSVYWYRHVALTDLLLWGPSLYAIVALVRPGSVHGPLRGPADVPVRSMKIFGADLTFPALAVVATFCAGAVLLSKVGSAANHLIELTVAASILCAAVMGSVWETPKVRRFATAGALMLVPMIAYNVGALQNDAGLVARAMLLKSWNIPLHLIPPEVVPQREALAAIVADLPKPLFIEDELFAMPWHATGNRYPTVRLDPIFYDPARHYGLVGRGVEGLFADRYFASAVLTDSSAFVVPAMHARYKLVRSVEQEGAETLRILVRTP